MKEFMLLFRSEKQTEEEFANHTPEQMQEELAKWDVWLGKIASQDKLLDTNALNTAGRIMQANGTVTDGPYVALKEMVGGFAKIKAQDFEEAIELTKGCPMFDMGGSVEIRDIMVFNQD